MGDLWIPGAERRQTHSGGGMSGGAPRVTWHITWDSLRSDGSPAIGFSAVANYLNDKGFQVHIVWDPVTGDIIQLLPANVGGAGLVHSGPPQTNNMGSVNLQIEAYFTPGVVRNGVRYDQLTDTPMAGLDKIMALADSWGIPHVAPLAPGDRNASVWVNQAGHYGHFNVPENDHGDPVVPIQAILDRAGSAPAPTQEEDLTPELQAALTAVQSGVDKHLEALAVDFKNLEVSIESHLDDHINGVMVELKSYIDAKLAAKP